ncbi:MAG TPA: hypothetical protein VF600_03660 [Abditibacteriaceae bacterium]|jgi:hypothetical protein
MSARCPVCHAALDMQFEQVPEDGAICRGCGSQVQAFQKDDTGVSTPSSKRRVVSPLESASVGNGKATWVAKA